MLSTLLPVVPSFVSVTVMFVLSYRFGRRDKEVIAAFILGHSLPPPRGTKLRIYNGGRLLLLPGGIEVAERANPNTILLNYDRAPAHPLMVRKARRRIYRIARKHGIDVVPVAFTPLRRALTASSGENISLVHRQGRECVFKTKKDYYLSGWDQNERPFPLYFLAKLPKSVETVDEAREALKPPSVLLAEAEGRKIFRQGDMFAMPTKITTAEIRRQNGKITHMVHIGAMVAATPLYGTAHTATAIATLPDGTQLAWGTLHHKPYIIGRAGPGDHRPCRLKKGHWHLVARNTVPMGTPSARRWIDDLLREVGRR